MLGCLPFCRTPLSDIKRLGGWDAGEVVLTSYMRNAPMPALMALAGVDLKTPTGQQYWHPRFEMQVCGERGGGYAAA